MGTFLTETSGKSGIERWQPSGLLSGLEHLDQKILADILDKGAKVIINRDKRFEKAEEKYGYRFECESYEKCETYFFPTIRNIYDQLIKTKTTQDICIKMNSEVLIDIYFELISMRELVMTPMKMAFTHLDWEAAAVTLFFENYCEKLKKEM